MMNKDFYKFNRQWDVFGTTVGYQQYIDNRNKNLTNFSRVFEVLKMTGGNLKNKRLIEFGCGYGSLTEKLVKKVSFVHGVDFSQNLIRKAEYRLKNTPNFAVSKIIRDFSILTDLSANVVLAVSILEHLPEDMAKRVIQDARRVLKRGGHLIIRLPLEPKHKVVYNEFIPALDTVYWTIEEVEKMAKEYKYEYVASIGFYSIFKKIGEI
jgi:ubiquinone/menaquinone biosynthesis C-methylase UbiE